MVLSAVGPGFLRVLPLVVLHERMWGPEVPTCSSSPSSSGLVAVALLSGAWAVFAPSRSLSGSASASWAWRELCRRQGPSRLVPPVQSLRGAGAQAPCLASGGCTLPAARVGVPVGRDSAPPLASSFHFRGRRPELSLPAHQGRRSRASSHLRCSHTVVAGGAAPAKGTDTSSPSAPQRAFLPPPGVALGAASSPLGAGSPGPAPGRCGRGAAGTRLGSLPVLAPLGPCVRLLLRREALGSLNTVSKQNVNLREDFRNFVSFTREILHLES